MLHGDKNLYIYGLPLLTISTNEKQATLCQNMYFSPTEGVSIWRFGWPPFFFRVCSWETESRISFQRRYPFFCFCCPPPGPQDAAGRENAEPVSNEGVFVLRFCLSPSSPSLRMLLGERMPNLLEHLDRNLPPEVLLCDFMLSLGCRSLPPTTLWRCFDFLFSEGGDALVYIALAVLHLAEVCVCPLVRASSSQG